MLVTVFGGSPMHPESHRSIVVDTSKDTNYLASIFSAKPWFATPGEHVTDGANAYEVLSVDGFRYVLDWGYHSEYPNTFSHVLIFARKNILGIHMYLVKLGIGNHRVWVSDFILSSYLQGWFWAKIWIHK